MGNVGTPEARGRGNTLDYNRSVWYNYTVHQAEQNESEFGTRPQSWLGMLQRETIPAHHAGVQAA